MSMTLKKIECELVGDDASFNCTVDELSDGTATVTFSQYYDLQRMPVEQVNAEIMIVNSRADNCFNLTHRADDGSFESTYDLATDWAERALTWLAEEEYDISGNLNFHCYWDPFLEDISFFH